MKVTIRIGFYDVDPITKHPNKSTTASLKCADGCIPPDGSKFDIGGNEYVVKSEYITLLPSKSQMECVIEFPYQLNLYGDSWDNEMKFLIQEGFTLNQD